jgi:hypothetical protein
LTQRILQTSPGIRNHPEVLLAALERAAPMLDRQGKEDLAEARNKFTEQRLEMAKDALREAVRNHDMQQQERVRAGDQRDTREARLAANSAVRNDATAQRLELQRQDLQRKIENGDRGAALTAWRQTIDALHKRATEVIQSSNQFNTMPEDEKKALLKEQNEAYQTQISQMRALAGSTTPRGGVAPPGAAPEPKIQGQVSPPSNGSTLVTPTTAPAAPGAIPPQVLQDAQSAIAKGAPRAAVIKRLQEQGYPTDGL